MKFFYKKLSSRAHKMYGILFMLIVLCISFPQAGVQSAGAPQEKFQPEIPVNEYWDFGSLNGLKLYVNNTDKGVIYALNSTGKLVWTIWGHDYGFSSYEIRLVHQKLFITTLSKDTSSYLLWVFNTDGKLAWKHVFQGYLDMPQMKITGDDRVILSNSESLSRGFIWSFDINTGKIFFKVEAAGGYLELQNGGEKIVASSGGIGSGRAIHRTIINGRTGKIEDDRVIMTDEEYGQDRRNVVYDAKHKRVYFSSSPRLFVPMSGYDVVWQLRQGPLYQLMAAHLDGSVKSVVLNDSIFSQEFRKDSVISYSFSKKNGSLLWKKELGPAAYYVFKAMDADGVLVLSVVCAQCSVSEEYKKMYANVRNINTEIWSVDEKTGKIIWKYLKIFTSLKDINQSESKVVLSTGDTAPLKEITLDLKTGKEVQK